MSYRFTTIITQENGWFVAKCVELGVASQGTSIEDANNNLKEAVELYLEDQPELLAVQKTRQAPIITSFDVEYG